jgi:ATP-dependent protease HslVU (ClpYQ) peptidase subunit
MSVIVVVKKDKEIVIASDSLTSKGSLLISDKYKTNNKKFIKYKDTYIGCVNDNMSIQMISHALENSEQDFYFSNINDIYTSILKLHKILKSDYYLSPKKKKDQDQTVEPTNLRLLIANSCGIFGVDEDKSIESFSKFWAVGSGASIALGAMYHVYDKYDAMKIAMLGIQTACEFDEGSALPIELEVIKEELCQ